MNGVSNTILTLVISISPKWHFLIVVIFHPPPLILKEHLLQGLTLVLTPVLSTGDWFWALNHWLRTFPKSHLYGGISC